MKKEVDKEIFELCLKYGRQSGVTYHLPISKIKITIDGRQYAEEYEDISSPCPCNIDGIQADTNTNSLAFHMHTAFATAYPLASNDWYNYDSLKQSVKNDILNCLKVSCKSMKLNKTYDKEQKRQKWMQIIKQHEYMYPKFEDENDGYGKFTNLKHSVDCLFCCGKVELEEGLKTYLDMLTFNVAVHIRIQYRTADDFYHDMYLSHQTGERTYRLYQWLETVHAKAVELCPDNVLDAILNYNPADLLKPKSFEFIENAVISIDESSETIEDEIPSLPEKPKNITELYKLMKFGGAHAQVGKVYWMATTVNDTDISSCIPVRIISNTFKKPDIKFELTDDMDRCYSYKYDYEKYNTELRVFETTIEYVNLETGLEESIVMMNSSSCYKCNDAKTYTWLYEIPKMNYIINDRNQYVIDNMHIKTKKDAEKETLKEFEKIFNLQKSLLIIKKKAKKLKTIKDQKTGLEWATSNVVIDDNYVFQRKYDLIYVIPKGYRLPTFSELQSMAIAHPFKENYSNESEMRYFRNDLGIVVKTTEEICRMGWSSRNVQPVCWTSFDKPLIKENPILCPYYKFMCLDCPTLECIEKQYNLIGKGAHVLLVKQTPEETKSELEKARNFIKESAPTLNDILKEYELPEFDKISHISFDINILNGNTDNPHRWNGIQTTVASTRHFKKDNHKTFEKLKKALSEFTGVKDISEMNIIIKDKSGSESFVNNYHYDIPISQLLPFLMLMVQYPKYASNLGKNDDKIKNDDILYSSKIIFLAMKKFIRDLGINDSCHYSFSYSQNTTYPYLNIGFSCTNVKIYTNDGNEYDMMQLEHLKEDFKFWLEYYVANNN